MLRRPFPAQPPSTVLPLQSRISNRIGPADASLSPFEGKREARGRQFCVEIGASVAGGPLQRASHHQPEQRQDCPGREPQAKRARGGGRNPPAQKRQGPTTPF